MIYEECNCMNARTLALYAPGLILLTSILGYFIKPVLIDIYRDQDSVRIPSAKISIRDKGIGEPVVVIISAMAARKDDYKKLQRALANHTRVLAYDRPGLGYSSENREPRTLDIISRDLEDLLEAMQVPPPYILVGHSLGGHVIRYFVNEYPDKVAGLVFLDTLHEDWNKYVQTVWSEKEQERPNSFWDVNNPDYVGVRREEKSAFETNSDMVRGLKIARNIPALMFTSGNSSNHFRVDEKFFEVDRQKWIEMQASILDGLEYKKQIVGDDMGHWLQRQKPEYISNQIAAFFELSDSD